MTENLIITTKPSREEREDIFHLAYSSVVDFPTAAYKTKHTCSTTKGISRQGCLVSFCKITKIRSYRKTKGMVLAVCNYGSHHEDVQGSGDITP